MTNITLKSGKVIKVDIEPGSNIRAPWQPLFKSSGRHYVVTVMVNRRRATFDYWGSYADRMNGVGPDARGAVSCWASDALVEIFDQYDDLGHVTADMVKGCIQAAKDARRLGLSDVDLVELSDY